MRAVVQRVLRARVVVRGETVGASGPGLCVLLGVVRIFENEAGKFDLSLLDVGGEALVVSQFTLIADTTRQRGTRPDFSRAAPREQAEPLYEAFCEALAAFGVRVETGIFGERMQLELVNDGPVTIVLDM